MPDTKTTEGETREQRLAGIRERESKATKGPWHVDDTPDDTVPQFIYDAKGRGVADTGSNRRPAPEQIINANFIAHARADIPYLLSALDSESERVLLEAAKAQCSWCKESEPIKDKALCYWKHLILAENHAICQAQAIHDLRSKGESR